MSFYNNGQEMMLHTLPEHVLVTFPDPPLLRTKVWYTSEFLVVLIQQLDVNCITESDNYVIRSAPD